MKIFLNELSGSILAWVNHPKSVSFAVIKICCEKFHFNLGRWRTETNTPIFWASTGLFYYKNMKSSFIFVLSLFSFRVERAMSLSNLGLSNLNSEIWWAHAFPFNWRTRCQILQVIQGQKFLFLKDLPFFLFLLRQNLFIWGPYNFRNELILKQVLTLQKKFR